MKKTTRKPKSISHRADKKGEFISDKDKPDFEKIPFDYPGGVDAYLQNEVRPFRADSWLDMKSAKIGYEVRFTKYFKHESDKHYVEELEMKISRTEEILAPHIDFLEQKKYSEYSDIDEIWFSELPEHWKAIKIKYLFEERSEKGFPNEHLLAATQNMGVVPKDVYGQRTVEVSKDLHLLKLVKPDDFVISLRSFQGGIEKAYYRGIIIPAYTILICKGLRIEYFKHLAKSPVFISLLQQCVTGIGEGQNIDYTTLKNIRVPVPPEDEQLQIAAVLDSIDARKKEIELLKKYKRSIMSDVVTGKLDVRGVAVPKFEAVEEVAEEADDEVDGDAEEVDDEG
ncbi:MAG: restriction endonuclease subunit S [Clostridiales bacterium]|jgi:restriction endonuclease S subunit|nr:restriction endonuclease subunit S [Clostridiales bacterium]